MKIPKEAKRIFKGVIFDVYQWEQEMYDGSKETYERLRMPDTVQIIPVTDTGKILVSHEEQPTKPLSYTFFGGHQERGEESLLAAQRELLEETGCVSDDIIKYGEYDPLYIADTKMTLYIARGCHKVAEPSLDPGEKIDVIETDFEGFITYLSRKDFLNKLIAKDILAHFEDDHRLTKFKSLLFDRTK